MLEDQRVVVPEPEVGCVRRPEGSCARRPRVVLFEGQRVVLLGGQRVVLLGGQRVVLLGGQRVVLLEGQRAPGLVFTSGRGYIPTSSPSANTCLYVCLRELLIQSVSMTRVWSTVLRALSPIQGTPKRLPYVAPQLTLRSWMTRWPGSVLNYRSWTDTLELGNTPVARARARWLVPDTTWTTSRGQLASGLTSFGANYR